MVYRSERDCIKHLGSRLFMFRTWIIRQCDTVWVRKLADIVTSLWLGIIELPKELFKVIYVCRNLFMISMWNKWGYESVDRSLTLISQLLPWKKKGTKLQQTTDKYHRFSSCYIPIHRGKGILYVNGTYCARNRPCRSSLFMSQML